MDQLEFTEAESNAVDLSEEYRGCSCGYWEDDEDEDEEEVEEEEEEEPTLF